ncbi:MAG TPA: 30S ribosomal protein S8 [Candidatus Paceibacterota bacterium]|nr:30S ribosomal protein S8 [Candidatus Paceibacterota bacterium]
MYYNILSELKNAVRARKDRVTFPYSKMDFAVLKVLTDGGYVKSAEKETVGRRTVIAVKLPAKDKALNDFKIVSKPSRHFYADYRSIRRVKQGHGIGVFSTSKGIMSDKQALKAKIGGEYLFEIW